jgi:hypothetical protein
MKNTEKKGLLALIGIGLGALAFLGYKKLPSEKKDRIKAKVNQASAKLKETGRDVKESISQTYEKTKGETKAQVNDLS